MNESAESLYYIKAPAKSKPTGSQPVLILLHGRGTDENDLLGLSSYFDPRFLLYSLRAPFPFQFGGYTWFTIDEAGAVNIQQLQCSHELLLKFLHTVQRSDTINSPSIFLFGFSMGAMMSLELALREPTLFKGVVAHSGFILNHENLSYTFNSTMPSILLLHGSYDPIVPVQLAKTSFEFLQKKKVHVDYQEYPIEHTISDESLRDAIVWMQKQVQ